MKLCLGMIPSSRNITIGAIFVLQTFNSMHCIYISNFLNCAVRSAQSTQWWAQYVALLNIACRRDTRSISFTLRSKLEAEYVSRYIPHQLFIFSFHKVVVPYASIIEYFQTKTVWYIFTIDTLAVHIKAILRCRKKRQTYI